MKAPTQADYVKTYFTLFERFEQIQAEAAAQQGRPYVYPEKLLIVFFTIMMLRHISLPSKHNAAGWKRIHKNGKRWVLSPYRTGQRYRGVTKLSLRSSPPSSTI